MFFIHRVEDSNVHVKMAQTKYTLEKPEDVAERIKKGKNVQGYKCRSCNPVFIRLCKLITFSDLEIYRNGEWVLGKSLIYSSE